MKTVVQHSLAVAVAAALTIGIPVAQADTVTGPGASHTVNPGDTREFWFVQDGAELNIAAGGAVGGVQVDAAHLLGSNVDVRGLTGIRLLNASTATINGGQIVIASSLGSAGGAQSGSKMNLDSMTVTSAGRGFSVSGVGSELTVRNSSIGAGGEALQVGDGGLLVLDNVSATTDGSASGAFGVGLRMYGGTAQVSNSTLSGASGGIRMEDAGELFVERSRIDNGLIMFGPTSDPTLRTQATLIGSIVTGSTAASIQNGSEVTLTGSTLKGTDTGADLINGTLEATAGSLIEGARIGVEISGNTQNTLSIDQSKVVAGSEAALVVNSNAKLDALIGNGSAVEAGNGVALELERGASANIQVSSSIIRGDMVARPTDTAPTQLNVDLADRSMLVGAIANGDTVSVSNSVWQLTGDSSVQQLTANTGSTIELGNGTTFNTLSVSGNYSGNDGTLIFNTVLVGDDAATDKLVIGGDTSGSTNVRVNNVGGAGAQTNQGIELISVGGASNGQFALAGRAVGGQYEYFLHKGTGTDGNWYLRSVLPTAPDPCDADPSLPGCSPELPDPDPDPVLRPEGGAYLANLRASQEMFRIGYHERNAGQNGGRAWARVDGSRNGFDAASRQLDIHGNSQAISVGADLWRANNGSGVGVILSSGNASSTSTNSLSGYYARGKVKGEALGIYATLRAGNTADPYAGFYLDGSVQRAQFRNRVEGVGLETERYDSRGWQGAVETGYAFRVGGNSNSSVFLEPQLQVGYNRWDDTRHTEANGTVVTTDDADGLFGRVGLRLSGVTRWEGRTAQVQPYLAANWLHSRAESQVRMDGELVDARIPRSRAEVSAGASVKFANGMGVWGGLSRQQASGYHLTSAQMGLSYSW